MGPTPVYGARAEKPLQNADFAMKQTNICRLSGDIIITFIERASYPKAEARKALTSILEANCNRNILTVTSTTTLTFGVGVV